MTRLYRSPIYFLLLFVGCFFRKLCNQIFSKFITLDSSSTLEFEKAALSFVAQRDRPSLANLP